MAVSSKKSKTEKKDDVIPKGFEKKCGLTLAIFAALLAVTDLGSGRFGQDELIAHNEKTAAYEWFQSKSIKQSLAEGERDSMNSLIAAGVISKDKIAAVKANLLKLEDKIKRYDKEKSEILNGSAKVGKDNWVLEVKGKTGQIIGANEWQAAAEKLGDAGDIFDYATLCLQISLVLGAISLMMADMKLKTRMFYLMIVMGSAGTVFSGVAYYLSIAASI